MALRTAAHDGPVLFLALELSRSAWLLAAHLPGANKPKLHRIEAGDTAALLATITALRARVAGKSGTAVDVACCCEAGRDGFWLHRLLTANGVASHVLETTSILVNRRARRGQDRPARRPRPAARAGGPLPRRPAGLQHGAGADAGGGRQAPPPRARAPGP